MGSSPEVTACTVAEGTDDCELTRQPSVTEMRFGSLSVARLADGALASDVVYSLVFAKTTLSVRAFRIPPISWNALSRTIASSLPFVTLGRPNGIHFQQHSAALQIATCVAGS